MRAGPATTRKRAPPYLLWPGGSCPAGLDAGTPLALPLGTLPPPLTCRIFGAMRSSNFRTAKRAGGALVGSATGTSSPSLRMGASESTPFHGCRYSPKVSRIHSNTSQVGDYARGRAKRAMEKLWGDRTRHQLSGGVPEFRRGAAVRRLIVSPTSR